MTRRQPAITLESRARRIVAQLKIEASGCDLPPWFWRAARELIAQEMRRHRESERVRKARLGRP